MLRLIFLLLLISPFYVLGQSVDSLTLVNADNEQDIGPLINGQVLNLSTLSTRNLNIRANTSPSKVGSVRFGYDTNSSYHIENIAPYALAGDNPTGNYLNWTPTLGSHILKATSYTGSNASGIAGTTLSISFTIKDSTPSTGKIVITGELKKWHKVTITFDGVSTSESNSYNPFLNYRLDVTFTNGTKSYTVPGYFAADGNAGETGATSGNKWRVNFSPDTTGTWVYKASFRKGTNIAVDDVITDGTATSFDGAMGSFIITASDKTGRDLRGKGLLKYVGSNLMKFAETGEFFRKAGADAPENFLAYDDFDNTPDSGGRRKSWSPHVIDWRTGDITWHNGKGKGIIGAVNYLSGTGANSFSFLTMNIKGDDKNVYPYVKPTDFTRIDVSKLDQWEYVFEHADKMGMHLHFKTQETENNNLLDSGNLGTTRKLYYRELIARFSHHLALNWNLGEENTQTTQQQKDMAKYFYDHDPYKHNIVLHTYSGQQETIYRPLLGSASKLTGVSIQTSPSNVYAETRKWVEASTAAGKKWIVANDEQNPADIGVACDANYTGNRGTVADNSDMIRQQVLWGNFMAGGAGVEYYFGYNTGETDLSCQDFRSRAKSWKYASNALQFFHNYLPFIVPKALNNVSTGLCLAKEGEIYVVYLKAGGTTNITLPTGNYSVKWYNPRTGGSLQNGSVTTIGSGTVSIGNPPSETTLDWIALIKRTVSSLSSVQDARINNEEEHLIMYPNPSSGIINITLKNHVKFVLNIYNSQGENIYSNKFNSSREKIDLSKFFAGNYYVQFLFNNIKIERKIVILK